MEKVVALVTQRVQRTGGAVNTQKQNTMEALRICASDGGRNDCVPIGWKLRTPGMSFIESSLADVCAESEDGT